VSLLHTHADTRNTGNIRVLKYPRVHRYPWFFKIFSFNYLKISTFKHSYKFHNPNIIYSNSIKPYKFHNSYIFYTNSWSSFKFSINQHLKKMYKKTYVFQASTTSLWFPNSWNKNIKSIKIENPKQILKYKQKQNLKLDNPKRFLQWNMIPEEKEKKRRRRTYNWNCKIV